MKIRRVVVPGTRGLYAGWWSSCEMAGIICMVMLALLLEGCTRQVSPEPVTLTFHDELKDVVVLETWVSGQKIFENPRGTGNAAVNAAGHEITMLPPAQAEHTMCSAPKSRAPF